MANERTLSIIKPDATRRNLTGAINAKIEGAGLRIVAQKRVKWRRKDAESFYKEQRESTVRLGTFLRQLEAGGMI